MEVILNGYIPAAENKRFFKSFFTKGEEIFNAVSHIVGGAIGVIAMCIGLISGYPNAVHMIASSVFSLCIIILYTMSALYHFLPNGVAKGVFRIFDHCTIFLLIAGTYTPFCLIALSGTSLGTGILICEWVCAAIGITMNAIAMKNKVVSALSMALYVIMGWAIVVAFPVLLEAISASSFFLLLGGGIAYTAGIVFFALGSKIKYFHSVWHLFDLAGTILHLFSILCIL